MDYESISDAHVVEMSDDERRHLVELRDDPTEKYRRLVVRLAGDGCESPLQQAALFLRNTPGVANVLLDRFGAFGVGELQMLSVGLELLRANPTYEGHVVFQSLRTEVNGALERSARVD